GQPRWPFLAFLRRRLSAWSFSGMASKIRMTAESRIESHAIRSVCPGVRPCGSEPKAPDASPAHRALELGGVGGGRAAEAVGAPPPLRAAPSPPSHARAAPWAPYFFT